MPGREAIGALELPRHMALVGKACVQRGFRGLRPDFTSRRTRSIAA
jgi:hypothetical protein